MKRTHLLLLLCVAALVLLAVFYIALKPSGSPSVSWSPVGEIQKDVRASASGKHIGLLAPSSYGDTGRLLILPVAGGKASHAPVFDSKNVNKFVWEFGWAGDTLVYVATEGISSAEDALHVFVGSEKHAAEVDVDDLALKRAREHAKCFQYNLKIGVEKVVPELNGHAIYDSSIYGTIITGNRPGKLAAINNYDARPKHEYGLGVITFLNLGSSRVVSVVDVNRKMGGVSILCWNPYHDGVVVVGGDPDAPKVPGIDPKTGLFIPQQVHYYVLVNVLVTGQATTFAHVQIDEDFNDLGSTFNPIHTEEGSSIAYFKTPSNSEDAIEVRFVPIDGKKERKLTIKKRDVPEDELKPVAVMPNGCGVLVQAGEERLYYCDFKGGKPVRVQTKMNGGVKRVFGPVGNDGLAIEIERLAKTDKSGVRSAYTVAGIVSVL